ncbi:MAG: Cof-type HAD-IIB family hydrolase [Actinomycetota bacterium]
MQVRLIATDLDGTFFGPDHRPLARNVAALNALQATGVICVAVTGRSHMGGVPLATSNGAELDWFIGSNGGHRVNLRTREMEERLAFDDAAVDAARTGLEAALPDIAFGFEAGDRLIWEQRFIDLYPHRLGGTLHDEDHRGDGNTPTAVGKMLIAHPDHGNRALIDLVTPHFGDDTHVTSSGIDFVEATPPGGHKGAALARLCAELDIVAEEVVAFGDNLNDLTMIEWAGRGIAMGNAEEAVKDVADEVTSANVDFGVARILEELI